MRKEINIQCMYVIDRATSCESYKHCHMQFHSQVEYFLLTKMLKKKNEFNQNIIYF